MHVRFKNREEQFNATNIVEQKLFNKGEAVGWLLVFSLSGLASSSELDSIVTKESISEIDLYIIEDEIEKQLMTFKDYEKISACSIKYTDEKITADIQLMKGV